MLTFFVSTILIFGAVFLHPVHLFDLELNDDWILYKEKFNKTYDTDELRRRMIWESNLRLIQKHNLEYDLGKHTYTMGINQFTDLTFEEFQSIYLPYKFDVKKNNADHQYLAPLNADVREEIVDWRTEGFVTEVKNQGACGSCWAFSTIGSLEGQHFSKTKKLISMSEQQLIDCSVKYGNNGCSGGLMSNAFNYIKNAGGIESEAVYPYETKEYSCRFNSSYVIATVSGYVSIRQTEAQLANAVFHVGPISVAIDASHPKFQSYKSGIYNEPLCSSTSLDHGVLVVGFGRDTANHSFWIVKNSWGPQWGDGGYILMTKDQHNQCGIATMAGYPLV